MKHHCCHWVKKTGLLNLAVSIYYRMVCTSTVGNTLEIIVSPHVIAVVARFVVGVTVGRHPELGVGVDGDEGGHLAALPPHHLHAALDGLALSLGEGRVPWNR